MELSPLLLGEFIFAAIVAIGLGSLVVVFCYALCVVLVGVANGEKQKTKLMASIERLSSAGWPEHSPDYETPTGWDTAHVQADFNWPEVRS